MSAGRAARCLATNWLQTPTTTTFAAHFCTPASSRNMVSRPCSRQIRPPKPPLTVHRPEIVPSMSWIRSDDNFRRALLHSSLQQEHGFETLLTADQASETPSHGPSSRDRPEHVVDPVIGAGSGAAGHRNHCKHWHAQGDVALSGLTHHPAKVETP